MEKPRPFSTGIESARSNEIFRSSDQVRLCKFTSAEEKALLSVISRHFNVHPFFCGHSMHHLFLSTLVEIKILYNKDKYMPLYEYLLKNWCGEDGQFLKHWGRRCDGYVASFARTFMFVEIHWS